MCYVKKEKQANSRSIFVIHYLKYLLRYTCLTQLWHSFPTKWAKFARHGWLYFKLWMESIFCYCTTVQFKLIELEYKTFPCFLSINKIIGNKEVLFLSEFNGYILKKHNTKNNSVKKPPLVSHSNLSFSLTVKWTQLKQRNIDKHTVLKLVPFDKYSFREVSLIGNSIICTKCENIQRGKNVTKI